MGLEISREGDKNPNILFESKSMPPQSGYKCAQSVTRAVFTLSFPALCVCMELTAHGRARPEESDSCGNQRRKERKSRPRAG